MSTKTTTYGLIKPELTDTADITQTNENWDVVDQQLLNANTHATNKNNPHGITPAQIGAQPTITYGTAEPTGGKHGDIYIQIVE